jgi:multidrug efflux pump subunit AcrB
MWFTRVSIGNPVMATMVMLAFVVLGLFSYQRLSVDQFPNIEFPTVVVQTEYPGAAPEVVESEVTRKIEESVNTIAGINQLYSRSYEGSSLVIVQFNLDMDGRRAADEVREKLALIKPLLRDEVKDSRVSRFDPAGVPIFSLAVTSPDTSVSVQALTTYADQVLKKRLENVPGVGSVALVGGIKREINVYLKPAALEAFGVGVDAVMGAVRTENQDLPAGSLRSAEAHLVQGLLALAAAAVLTGAMMRAMAMAIEWAGTRVQFGRPIGQFQAVQHSLALAAEELAASRAALDWAAQELEAGRPMPAAAIAKSRAAEAAGKVAAITHQVHGAIGFTAEFALYRSSQQLWLWRDRWGDEHHWNAWLGRQALAAGPDGLFDLIMGESTLR